MEQQQPEEQIRHHQHRLPPHRHRHVQRRDLPRTMVISVPVVVAVVVETWLSVVVVVVME